MKNGRRNIKGSYFRLLEKSSDKEVIEYISGEKSEKLIVGRALVHKSRNKRNTPVLAKI